MYSVARIIKELPENYEEECEKQGAVREMARDKKCRRFDAADINTPAKRNVAA